MAEYEFEHYSTEEIAEFLAGMFGAGKKREFLRVLKRRKGDLYSGIAAVAYGFKEKDVTPTMRNPIKTMLFGLFYGGRMKRKNDEGL